MRGKIVTERRSERKTNGALVQDQGGLIMMRQSSGPDPSLHLRPIECDWFRLAGTQTHLIDSFKI